MYTLLFKKATVFGVAYFDSGPTVGYIIDDPVVDESPSFRKLSTGFSSSAATLARRIAKHRALMTSTVRGEQDTNDSPVIMGTYHIDSGLRYVPSNTNMGPRSSSSNSNSNEFSRTSRRRDGLRISTSVLEESSEFNEDSMMEMSGTSSSGNVNSNMDRDVIRQKIALAYNQVGQDPPMYQCKACGILVKGSRKFNHYFVHNKEKFVCPICNCRYKRRDTLRDHVFYKHPGSNLKV